MPDPEFILKSSKRYVAILVLGMLMSIGIVASLSMSLLWKFLIGLVISIYSGKLIWQFGLLQTKHAIRALRCYSNGRWQVHTPHQIYDAILRKDSTVTPVITILRFQIPKKRLPISCVVLPDSLPTNLYRRLRVVVRFS